MGCRLGSLILLTSQVNVQKLLVPVCTFCSEIPCSFVVLELLSYTLSFCFWDCSTVKSKKRLGKLEENMYLTDLLYVFLSLIG